MNIKQTLSAAALVIAASSASAGLIETIEAENVFTSQQAGVTTIDFESGAPTGLTGQFTIYDTPSGTGQSASPYGITDHFLSVPNPVSSGTATNVLGASYNYFGLYWGSVDDYNTIEFFNGSDLVASYTGEQVHADILAHGGQADWASNRYVNFFFTDGMSFDSYALTSTNFAFETDNHAYGNVSVSEPASLALLGLGVLALGWSRRKAS